MLEWARFAKPRYPHKDYFAYPSDRVFYKDSNGDSKLDLLLRAAGDYIDRQRDCNFGLGVRNAIF